jgi:hypothetical protein
MCFSSEASFAVGAVLLPAGLYCVRSAVRKDRKFLAFSLLPVLFSIQQIAEGFVWIGLENDNLSLTQGAAQVFLYFALFFWPFWVPFSVSFFEPRTRTRQLLSAMALVALALGWALYAPILLDTARWLNVRVVGHSIQYDFRVLPAFDVVAGQCWLLLYLASICGPLLISYDRRLRLFAMTLGASAVISYVVFRYAFESVWCFFAAALSLQLCHVFHELRALEGGNAPEVGGRSTAIRHLD